MVMGQKVEAATLRVTANNQGFQLKGDVKIGGTPASLEYHKPHGDGDAEVHIQATLDQAARANLGFDNASEVSGAIPIRLAGRIASTGDHEGRFAVEADLTSAQIDGLLPGWVKPVGKPARATFTLATKPQSVRIEDLVIEGAGGGVKGTLDFDGRHAAGREFLVLRIFRRRQGDAQGRTRPGRDAARHHARRRLRRPRLRQDHDRRIVRPEHQKPDDGYRS